MALYSSIRCIRKISLESILHVIGSTLDRRDFYYVQVIEPGLIFVLGYNILHCTGSSGKSCGEFNYTWSVRSQTTGKWVFCVLFLLCTFCAQSYNCKNRNKKCVPDVSRSL